MKEFSALTQEEVSQLKDAIPLITVLVAGADDDIDTKETEWAEKVTKIRTYNSEEFLLGFYEEVGKVFSSRLEQIVSKYPKQVKARQTAIAEKLENLNPILASLRPDQGAIIYKDLITFAHHVAKASGGFLGFLAIGPEESKVVDLPMLTEIIYIPEETEEEEFEDPLA